MNWHHADGQRCPKLVLVGQAAPIKGFQTRVSKPAPMGPFVVVIKNVVKATGGHHR